MAQERTRRARRLASRYGVAGRAAVAAALAAAALAAAVGVALGPSLAGDGVVIERADEGGAAGAAPGAEGEAAASADGSGAEADAAAEAEAPAAQTVVVHVDGSVGAPGVYELAEGSRVNDAVLAAGGLAEGADTSSLNLAAPLADGDKVHVPRAGETPAAGAADPAAPGGAAAAAPAGPINLNTATAEELDALPGVGEATARAIVEDRAANGPFSTPEDLMRVSGIGEKKFEKIRGHVCV